MVLTPQSQQTQAKTIPPRFGVYPSVFYILFYFCVHTFGSYGDGGWKHTKKSPPQKSLPHDTKITFMGGVCAHVHACIWLWRGRACHWRGPPARERLLGGHRFMCVKMASALSCRAARALKMTPDAHRVNFFFLYSLVFAFAHFLCGLLVCVFKVQKLRYLL